MPQINLKNPELSVVFVSQPAVADCGLFRGPST